MISNSPKNTEELMHRARQLVGLNFSQLASMANITCPSELLHAKGWLGQVLERLLGADAGSKAQPDFVGLNIELKTLPINAQGIPQETTYVTHAPIPFTQTKWEDSTVFKKLNHVLWIPYHAKGPIAQRQIAMPFLWQLDPQWDSLLCQDWYELTEKLRLGQFASLNASLGRFLHIRPKAANSKIYQRVLDCDGDPMSVVPKGFYLRTSMTKEIIRQTFGL